MKGFLKEKVSFSYWIRRRLTFGFVIFTLGFGLSLASSFHSFWVYKNLESRTSSLLAFTSSSPVPNNPSGLDLLQGSFSPEWRSQVHDLQIAIENKNNEEAEILWASIKEHLEKDQIPFQESSRQNLIYFFLGTIVLGLTYWIWTWRTFRIVRTHLSHPVANLHESIKRFDGELRLPLTSRFTDLEALSQELLVLHKRLIDEGKQEITSYKLATLSDMAMNLANEIRGPLRAIDDLSQEILDDEETSKNEKISKNSVRIQRQTELLSQMAEALLDFASLKDDKTRSELSLKEIIDKCVALIKPQLEERKVGIKIDVPETLKVRASQIQFEEVFYHLLSNAKDAVEKYSGHIQIRAKTSDSQVEILIIDNGHGIPEDKVEKVWEPFFTTKSKRSGSGLGLSVVRQIITAHGGNIQYKRVADESHFIIQLPIEGAQKIEPPKAA